MRASAFVLLSCVLLSSTASAEETLDSLSALHAACRQAEEPGRRQLYVVDVPRYRFERYDPDASFLPIDTRRNLRALGGSVELMPAGLESVGFVGGEDRARALRGAEGTHLRLGFFLGFDGDRQACLIRPSFGVTTVRFDLAYVELVTPSGEVVAREDTERLRAWRDDMERDGIPGEGPRAAVDAPSEAPAAWRNRLGAEGLARELGRCFGEARQRGAEAEATVLLRLKVDGATGRVQEAEIALSTIRDDAAQRCILETIRSGSLGSSARTGVVELGVPLRFLD